MANRQKLKVEKRKVLGKKISKLRKSGIFPANIYGKDIKSEAVQVPFSEFEAVFKEAGSSGLIDVELDGAVRPVLIHNVQLDHITKIPLHADFYQVNLKEKVKTMVPLEIVGEPKAVTDQIGLLMQTLNEIEVEALPADLPEKIEVNVENLSAVDEQIIVSDLKKPAGVDILTDENQVVAKIAELVSKEAEADAAAAEAAAEETKAEGQEADAKNAEEVKAEGAEAEAEEAKSAEKESPKDEKKTE